MIKLVYGLGINDANYQVASRVDGRLVICEYYTKWRNLIRRCSSMDSYRSFEDNNLFADWIYFSRFKSWMETQNWKGLELDKDILSGGTGTYSPETCAFVPRYLNTILNYQKYKDGKNAIGVTYEEPVTSNSRPYAALISVKGKRKYLGSHKTSEAAHKAWQWAKAEQIENAISWYATQGCFRTDVADSLMKRVWDIRNDHANNRETEGY